MGMGEVEGGLVLHHWAMGWEVEGGLGATLLRMVEVWSGWSCIIGVGWVMGWEVEGGLVLHHWGGGGVARLVLRHRVG